MFPPCLGDVDNDGDLDLWLGRVGKDLVFINDGNGVLVQGALPPTAGDDRLTACAPAD